MLTQRAQAPAVELPDLNGQVMRLKDLLTDHGRVLLAFFKTSCPTCQFTFPYLERFHRSGKLHIMGVSQDGSRDTAAFNAEFGVTFPVLLDDRKSYPASNAYGLTHVPSMFLVDRNGTISWVSDGFSKSDLEELGRLVGFAPFGPGDNVPSWKAG